ncbi:hypothetical protein [Loigolactobacillus coryniformis]|uniref:AbrB family transcriptional regulator n=1 Tax=Loigolactobacillus coryniformis TaxID=1610 RepID=A0A5B8TMS3_9LACO|nr:hypothetical protein [Loigolactobacillus coryniformis]MDT3394061.1 hypothetical protein [Bacillota bacterium]QEA53184.1 hypothetical protein FGL77_07650 [Loigolactobacillus coryniformis]RRG02785.1 MAG: hypothetical protein DUD28_10430 [Lactobacillus sp.]
MTVKTRKVSNTTVLTVPSSFKVPENIDFEPSINERGDIIYRRVEHISENRKKDIHTFMNQFQPVADYLKDK